jgi:hypothetical protein
VSLATAIPTGSVSAGATTNPTATAGASVTAETRPPPTTLRDESGVPVEGQIGTFAWAGIVSSSPLLKGAPAVVRIGRDLGVVVVGDVPTSWRATLYADPARPATGRTFGQGAGPVRLLAPSAAGTWTLALRVTYPEGEVLHFWRLKVTE